LRAWQFACTRCVIPANAGPWAQTQRGRAPSGAICPQRVRAPEDIAVAERLPAAAELADPRIRERSPVDSLIIVTLSMVSNIRTGSSG